MAGRLLGLAWSGQGAEKYGQERMGTVQSGSDWLAEPVVAVLGDRWARTERRARSAGSAPADAR